MRSSLDAAAFEAWMDEHRPGWRMRKIIADAWSKPLVDRLYGKSPLLEHFKP